MRTSIPRIRSIIAATLTVMILAACAALLAVPSGTEAQTPRNNPPTFTEGDSTTRAFNETLGDAAVTTASNIGRAVNATDPNTGTTLEYSLEGTDAPKFGIISTSGQIQTRVGERYDHEAKPNYTATVRVVDGNGGSDTITVTLNVTDQIEAPLAPLAPIPLAPATNTRSLRVDWTAPTNTGRPGITSYDLRYKVQGASGWTDGPQDVTATSDTIGSLTPGTPYRVQVRATNADGDGSWSQSGTGTTTTMNEVPNNWSLVPGSLSVGDQFRLLFLSSTSRTAASTDIQNYNTFVQDLAAAGHADIQAYSADFRIVGCTQAVDARDNTGTNYTGTDKGVPIYWLGGTKVADDYEDFYDGDWDDEANDTNESGTNGPDTAQFPFTGCEHDGTEAVSSGGAVVSHALGSTNVRTGQPNNSDTDAGPISSNSRSIQTANRPVYGLSEIYQVVANEVPADWSLIPTGLVVGDQFRLLFLSSTKQNATLSNIADYNAFVQNRAAAGHPDIQAHSSGFRVVGCTGAIDARDNTDTRYTSTNKGVPIYWLNGNKVADEYEDFYDGDWDDEANDTNQSGMDGPDTSNSFNHPVTGCEHNGTEAFSAGNVSEALGKTNVRVGLPNSSATGAGPISSGNVKNLSSSNMYGLSEVYQVAESITIHDATATEGSPVEFQVTLSNALTETVTVRYSTSVEADDTASNNPTAVGGSDFHITSGTIAIPPGETSSVISIATNDDTADEADQETFTLTLSNPTEAALGAPSSAKGTITDNDDPLPPVDVLDDWSLVPAGLVVGDQFRLLFLSSTSRNATSTDIADYDTFIQGVAAAGHPDIQAYSSGFRVVGCTRAADARDNTGTTYAITDKAVHIYWLAGAKVADDYEDFYDGDWDDEANDRNESGSDGPDTAQSANRPFTGCDHDGTDAFISGTSEALGRSNVRVGQPDSSTSGAGPINGASSASRNNTRPMYGLSGVFRVVRDTTPVKVLDNWSLVPAGLVVGDQFRLLFLSSTSRNATSTVIADYNTFVQDLAAAGHADIQAYSADFRIVGCTAAVDARDNTETRHASTDKGVPIYWLAGAKVADDYEDFYDGDWDDEANDRNESGTDGPDTAQRANYPFTGCDHDGTEMFLSSGSEALGQPIYVRVGRPGSSASGSGPINGVNASSPFPTETRPMYGLSGLFQVESSGTTDATLSGLALVDAGGNTITLDPTFESNTINYTASVANSTDSVTLTATKNDANATAAITGDDDTSTPDNAVLALVIGSNTLTVTVTAVNTTTTLTYTVNVTRTDVLVSNTGQPYESSDSDNIQAQSFVTGSRVGGYAISEVDLLLKHVSGRNTSTVAR